MLKILFYPFISIKFMTFNKFNFYLSSKTKKKYFQKVFF